MKPGLTVLANVAVDRVNDHAPSPGGCPSFARIALGAIEVPARVVTRMAATDRWLFDELVATYPVDIVVLAAQTSNAFQLHYQGEHRTMVVDGIGDAWTPTDIDAANIDTEWVHIAPLLRDEFPLATLQHLVKRGHVISYDGQGLIRKSRLGEMIEDAQYDAAILPTLTVLKMAEEEAAVVFGGAPSVASVAPLGVPEVLVTLGSLGCDIYSDATCRRIPVSPRVFDVHTTGAGDVFAVSYASFRSLGIDQVEAAQRASSIVAAMLESRR
jgi:sugar/nucleoside kinase (ribokinase family)